jgi:hypothetical protein
MTKPWRIAFTTVGAAVALACGLLLAQMQSGSYGSTNAATIRQSGVQELTPDAKYSVSPYSSLTVELAAGEGRLEVQSFCMTCHSTRYITMQPPLPAASWEAEVKKMIMTYGAPIPEAGAKKITAYLQEHYTTDNRKN